MLVYGSYIQVPNLGVTLFGGYCDDSVSVGIWVIHTGPKSRGKLVMLFGGYCDDSAGIWIIHRGPKSGVELVTLFGGYCDDSVSAGIWVIQIGGAN